MKIIFAFLLSIGFILYSQAQDAVPKLINYQGKLTDAAGAALGGAEGGVFTLRFEIFPVATGGNATWAETRTANVVGGVFNVVLGGNGSTNTVGDLGAAFTGKDRFLQTTVVSGPGVASPQTLLPRQQIASVPYAIESANGVPPGSVAPFFGAVPPAGWLLCDGQSYPRTGIYQRLFAAIGVSCGAPNSDTFNVPDLRGVFLRGIDNMGTSRGAANKDPDSATRTAMSSGGNAGPAGLGIATFQTMKTARPITPFTTDTTGSHSHAFTAMRESAQGNDGRSGNGVMGRNNSLSTDPAGAHSHTVTAGGDNETRPINIACNYIIKL